MQLAGELEDELELAFDFLKGGGGIVEVPFIGEAVGPHRPPLRQLQRRTVILADVPAHRVAGHIDSELQAPWDDGNLTRRDLEHAAFRAQRQRAELRHDQGFTIGDVQVAPVHGPIGRVEMNGAAELGCVVAGRCVGGQAVHEVSRLLRQLRGVPAHRLRRRRLAVQGRGGPGAVVDGLEWPLPHRGPDAVEPSAPVFRPRGREGGAAELLGVQPERRALRAEAAFREGAGKRLALVLVAEAAQGWPSHSRTRRDSRPRKRSRG